MLLTPFETRIIRAPTSRAADWQRDIAVECRGRGGPDPRLIDWLKSTGVIGECCFLVAEDDGPLCFRWLGRPPIQILGMDWGRSMLGQPETLDPNDEFSAAVSREYEEAIGSGEPIFNTVTTHAAGVPLSFTHLLFGWRDGRRRAVLSAVKLLLH